MEGPEPVETPFVPTLSQPGSGLVDSSGIPMLPSSASPCAATRASSMSVWIVNRKMRPSAAQQMAHASRLMALTIDADRTTLLVDHRKHDPVV
jgi:hypothetical protein